VDSPSGPLRILFLDSWRPAAHDGSGTAVGISTLTRALQGLGHRVEVLRPERGAGTLPGRLAFNLTLPSRLREAAPFDLVVGFDVDGFLWGPSSRRDTPYIVGLKGVAADEARFSRSAGERWLLSTLGRLEQRNAGHADLVLVPSDYSAGVASRVYGLPASRIRIVPEPIDLAPWDELRRSSPAPPERPTILSVARQYPRKDTATLLRALARVRERVPDVHLRIVGGGPEIPALRTLAGELELGDSLTLHGALAEDRQVREAYFAAHVFCLPSRQEGFGIVFLEAMAAGLPVVAARAGAVPEVVEEGETAILVPPGDPDPLADALVRLLQDPVAARRMGEAGLRRARRYDLEPVARAFLDAVSPRLRAVPA
jgi:glycosyltransferase involved in cell wall biosynthesis